MAAYLILSGYLAGWLGAALVLTILALWMRHSYQLTWPFYALPYAILIFTALHEVPSLSLLAMGYLAGTLAMSWSRFWQQHLPEFFEALGSLQGENGRQAPKNSNNGHV